jgi:glycosyltransferase involved in cell wall biosynthesis
MAYEPLVKVVLTTYNRLDLVKQALETVFAQTYRRLYIVIVDDASTDGTGELAATYAAAHPDRVTAIVKAANRGLADSMRTGILSGPPADYVAFLNDDDLWYPDIVERQLEIFARDPGAGLVYSGADLIDSSGRLTGKTFSDLYGRYQAQDLSEIFWANRMCGSALLIRSDVARLGAVTMPDTLLTWDYWVLLVAAGHSRIVFMPESLACYRLAESAMHVTQRVTTMYDVTRSQEELLKRHPGVFAQLGGLDVVRRKHALRVLELYVWRLESHAWREALWFLRRLLSYRQLRPAVWAVIHTARFLRGTGHRGAQ